jgi:AraC-like DNA-binding protein/ligand-binding sensor protein
MTKLEKLAMQYQISQALQESLNHFSALTGVRIAFFGGDGEEFMVGEARRGGCEYCALRRKDPGFDHACCILDAKKIGECRRKGKLVTYGCHGGLQESIMPVHQNERIIGFIMMGQYRAGKGGANLNLSAPLLKEYRTLASFTEEEHRHLLGLFKDIVLGVSARNLVKRRSEDPVETVMTYLRENRHRTVSLGEAAAHACRSTSTISHSFKDTLGKSFKQIQTEEKLNRAADLLKRDPTLSVTEVAASVGFTDPLYFSRRFKKHFGVPPSQMN